VRGFSASAVAVLLVAAVIGVIYVVRGGGDDSSTITPAKSPTPTVSLTRSASPTPTPTVTQTSTPPASTSVQPTQSLAAPAVVPGSRGTIYVYSAPGAETKLDPAGARFTAAGYAVNQRKAVSLNPAQTTVYYDAGMANAAAEMVAANVGVLSAAPRPPEYISTGTLFVVVTPNFS
jgi:hypothetical protein